MDELTGRQRSVMDFLRSYISEHGYPPTLREIGGHFGIKWSAARAHLKAIARKGLINLIPGRSRGIEVPGMGAGNELALPLVGHVTAGLPALAVEDFTEQIVVDKNLFKDNGSFVLRVKGDSMVEAGIFDGDYAVVRPQSSVTTNEIAVVLIGGQDATLKKVRIKRNSITLLPMNQTMQPMTYSPAEVGIVGKVVGIIRTL